MKKRNLVAVAAAMIWSAATSASAEVVDVTWTGTILWGIDETGVFGPAATDLTGNALIARFAFDTSLGTTYTDSIQSVAYANGVTSPLLSASATINGISIAINPGGFAQILGYNDSAGDFSEYYNYSGYSYYYYDQETFEGLQLLQQLSGVAYGPANHYPASITSPVTITPGDTTQLYLYYDVSITDSEGNTKYESLAYALADASRVTVTLAVPEPATTALFGIGVAGIGFLRRRQSPIRVESTAA